MAGDLPWCQRRKFAMADQTIPTANEQTVTWNSTENDYPALFAANGDGIEVLTDGLYSIMGRIFWVSAPNTANVYVNQIDPGGFASYDHAAVLVNHNITCSFSIVARLSAGQIPFITVYHEFGGNRVIEGNEGTFMEVRRLGDSTVTGLQP